ncbi:hypothetical protein [Neobacillus sp. Marseille-QA0830]
MEQLSQRNHSEEVDFSEILRKAYEKGSTETEMTVQQLIEYLKIDLQQLVVNDI